MTLPKALLLPPLVPSPLPSAGELPPSAAQGPALLVYRNAALSIANGFAFATIPYDTVENPLREPTTFYTPSTGLLKIPVAGLWWVDAAVIFNAAGAYSVALQTIQNGGSGIRLDTGYNGAGNAAAGGGRFLRCNLNDTLGIQVAQNSAVNPAPLFVGQAFCWAQFVWWAPLS